MLRKLGVLSACLALVGWAMSARAQDDELRNLMLKAQKAHGGKEAIGKYPGMQAKYKGDVDANGMQAKVDGEVSYHYPERMKNVINVDINGMKIEIQQGYDGKVLWLNVAGMNQEIKDKELLDEMKENLYSEQVTSLSDIDSKDYTFASLGDMKIKDKDAVGIRVSKKGKRDVNMWLDKKTLLLVKSEFRGKDPFGMQAGEANQEKFLSGYKAVNGVQTPFHMEVHNDGKKIVALEITEIQYHEKLDESHFKRP